MHFARLLLLDGQDMKQQTLWSLKKNLFYNLAYHMYLNLTGAKSDNLQ